MRAGTAFVPNKSPEVFIAFFNINPAGGIGAQVGANYVNYATGGTQRRLIRLETTIEPYTGIGICHLLNQDQALNLLDFRGCIAAISWNWHTGAASNEEYFWVTSERKLSSEGRLIVELQLANAWEMLQHSKGINVALAAALTNPATGTTRLWPRTTTVHNILAAIIGDVNGFLGQWGLTGLTVLSNEPAGPFAIQTYQPYVVSRIGEDDRTLMRRLLQMTQSAITFRQATGATQNYINPAMPGPYKVYDLAGVNSPFFIHVNGSALTMPNRILFADLEPDPNKNVVANFVGQAVDALSSNIGLLAELFYDITIGYPHANPPTIPEIAAGNTEATARATAMLARKIAEANLGEVYIPMDCTAELYDEIQVTDSISGQTVIGRIGRIERKFIAVAQSESFNTQRESYSCRIHLGGIGGGSLRTKSYTGFNDIDAAALDMKSRGLHNPFVDYPQINQSTLSQHLAPIERSRTATAPTVIPAGAPGAMTPITGIARTFTVMETSIAKVTATFQAFPGGATVVGNSLQGFLNVDAVNHPKTCLIITPIAAGGWAGTVEMTWHVRLAAGVHTLLLQAQCLASAGLWTIGVTTTMAIEIISDLQAEVT
jgi:hypothetical protein